MTTNTIQATNLLTNILNAVDAIDNTLCTLPALYEARTKALEAMRGAGFKSVQSGKSLRYNKNAAPLAGEYSYTVAVAEFEARLLARTPKATKAQLDANNKQRIASLNFWLINGKFTTNVGKDKARLEHEVASEKFSEASLEALRIANTAKLTSRQALENKKLVEQSEKAIKATKATIERLSKNDGEIEQKALLIAKDKAKLEQDNLTTLKANLKQANKLSTKAQADKAAADRTAANAKQAQADKAAAELAKKIKTEDMTKLAAMLASKYSTEQIALLISELQKNI